MRKKIASSSFRFSLFTVYFSLFTFLVASCWRPAGIGVGGRYLDAKLEVVKPRGGDLNKAVSNLEDVVVRDPFYRDSLTLLGRAYYKQGRYRDALQVLKRSLAVNREDEIAWIALGLTQLRLGDGANGLESLKGGLTLLSKASRDGYKGIQFWDRNGHVRVALRRAVLAVAKGLEDGEGVIRSGEVLLARVDDEEWFGSVEKMREGQMPQ